MKRTFSHYRAIRAALAVIVLAATASTARAVYDSPILSEPPPKLQSTGGIVYPQGVMVRNVQLTTQGATAPLPPPGGTSMIDSFFDVFTELSLDSGQTWNPTTAHANTRIADVARPLDGTPTRYFDTEMLQLDISGGSLPPTVRIRESPTLQSTGHTSIRDIGGGMYRIDSFFDVFTELSVDGGQSWGPSNGAAHLEGVPEPSTIALLGCGAVAALMFVVRRRKT